MTVRCLDPLGSCGRWKSGGTNKHRQTAKLANSKCKPRNSNRQPPPPPAGPPVALVAGAPGGPLVFVLFVFALVNFWLLVRYNIIKQYILYLLLSNSPAYTLKTFTVYGLYTAKTACRNPTAAIYTYTQKGGEAGIRCRRGLLGAGTAHYLSSSAPESQRLFDIRDRARSCRRIVPKVMPGIWSVETVPSSRLLQLVVDSRVLDERERRLRLEPSRLPLLVVSDL